VRRNKRETGIPRLALLLVALLLPAASLMPFGTLWLWQHGYILYWALATGAAVASVYFLERRLISAPASGRASEDSAAEPGEDRWSERQEMAWRDVLALAASVRAERITSRDAVLGLGLETIETVAKRLNPERRDPLLQFTVPEALAVIEQASANLRTFIAGSFPLGDRITVAQAMWLYRWRGVLDLVEKGYDIWRIVRLLNPVNAATQEVRERFTRQVYEAGREHLARRLAQGFVKEVGRAAIDLYGGSLRVPGPELQRHVTSASRRDLADVESREAEPLRILVAGQIGAGKSSLINALAQVVAAAVDPLPTTAGFTAYRLTHEGLPAALIIDSPGLADASERQPLIAAADGADMVLWVASATRAAREVDARALAAIREHFASETQRRRPPMLLVLTHIDHLRPLNEWEPPYDLVQGGRAKAMAIRSAMEAAGRELGFTTEEIVPVRVDRAYNVDALWAKLIELVPEAQRARLLRTLDDVRSASGWATLWSQAANAGRVIKRGLTQRNTPP
jgi:predicted GTPase